MTVAAQTITSAFLVVVLASDVAAEGNNAERKPRELDTNTPVQVFIVAGQSNAKGYNNIGEYRSGRVEFPRDHRFQPNVLFWESGEEWSALSIPDSGAFGPEIGFAYDQAVKKPAERIAIIKYAVGGTGIARSSDYRDYIPALKDFNDEGNNWYPPTAGRKAGLLYQRLMKNVRDALAALDRKQIRWELAGCLWMQGEHEAGISRKMAEDYDKLLSSFMSAVRTDLNAPALPFVVGEVNSHKWAYGMIVRTKQALVCRQDRHAVLVTTTDLPREGSGGAAHFDADGMLVLGSRFATALNRLTDGNETEQAAESDTPSRASELTR